MPRLSDCHDTICNPVLLRVDVIIVHPAGAGFRAMPLTRRGLVNDRRRVGACYSYRLEVPFVEGVDKLPYSRHYFVLRCRTGLPHRHDRRCNQKQNTVYSTLLRCNCDQSIAGAALRPASFLRAQFEVTPLLRLYHRRTDK